MKKLELNDVIHVMHDSQKWMHIYYDDYPKCFAHFIYAPELPDRIRTIKLIVPMLPGHCRKPDLNQKFVAKVLLDTLHLATFDYDPKSVTASFSHFSHWLFQLVNDPETAIKLRYENS